jgi:hypothetical protein
MLRVYSSIRKSLLAENKTVKYLKYAVGEVLLIMVGIILALQFQTWNEGRKLDQQRLELIENLKADFRNNLEVLEQSSLSIRKKYDDLLLFRQAAAGERNDLSVDELKLLAANGFGGGYRFQPALGSYRTALSTGSIGLLKDPILNQLFVNFEDANVRFQSLAEPNRTLMIHGNALELRKQLGSIYALLGMEHYKPEVFSLSNQQYRELIAQKEVYGIFEAKSEAARRMSDIMVQLKEITEQILTALEAF